MGGHWGEEVTPVERRRDWLQPEGGPPEVHRLGGAPEPLQRGAEQPVVGADQ